MGKQNRADGQTLGTTGDDYVTQPASNRGQELIKKKTGGVRPGREGQEGEK